MKKTLSILLALSLPMLFSCNIGINDIKINNTKSFKIKNNTPNIVQNTDLTYYGDWNENSNVHQTSGTINNDDPSLLYSGNWLLYSNGLASGHSYKYVKNGIPLQLANDTSSNITYLRNGWLTHSAFTYNDISSSNIYRITNQETDINKIKYIYTGSLGSGPKEEEWSNTMHPVWRTQTSSGGISYTESRESTSKIEIQFTGTNIQVYQFKTPLMGECRLKVYDSSNNEIRNIPVNLTNSVWQLSKTIISGLPNDNNKLVIEGVNGNRFNFVRSETLPSIEYKFNGNNIVYNAFTSNNSGKVNITIDNDPSTTTTVDLYNSSNIYQNIFERGSLESGEHTITVDALGERNTSSTGFRINVNDFRIRPAVRGEFTGEFLNLMLIGTPDSGKADLYIDNVFNREIDMYSSGSSYYSINVDGLTNTNHTFYLVAKNTKNESSSETRINFDGYTNKKASYTFTGKGIKYFANKNNNQGKVDVWIDGNKYGTYDLYSPTLQTSQEIVNITGLTNTSHTIDIIPSGTKRSASSGYNVNIDYLEVYTRLIPRMIWHSYITDPNGDFIRMYSLDYNEGSFNSAIPVDEGNVFSPVLSSNGNTVAYILQDESFNNKIYATRYDGNNWSNNVMISNATDNSSQKVTADGNSIFWIGTNEGTTSIYLSRYEGNWTAPQTIFSSSSIDIRNLQINSDGNIITFSSYKDHQNYDLYFLKYDGSNWTSPTLLFNIDIAGIGELDYKLSSNGNRLVWSGVNGTYSKIHVSDYDGTNWSTPSIISFETTDSFDPKISSDGNKIIYSSTFNYQNELYLSSYNGSNWNAPILLSQSGSTSNGARISLNGNTVAWNNNDNIYASNYDGSNWSSPNLIASNQGFDTNLEVSSDGNNIIWLNANNNYAVYVSHYNSNNWSSPISVFDTYFTFFYQPNVIN